MAQFDIIDNSTGRIVEKTFTMKGDASTLRKFTVAHKAGASKVGTKVDIDWPAGVPGGPMSGQLDATGRFNFSYGPSQGAKGSSTVLVTVGSEKDSFGVRLV